MNKTDQALYNIVSGLVITSLLYTIGKQNEQIVRLQERSVLNARLFNKAWAKGVFSREDRDEINADITFVNQVTS